MKKAHILLSVILAGVVASAYGTCYLQQVICCYTSGEAVTGYTPSGCASGTTVYATEEAWSFNTYSVSAGGRGNATALDVWCDGVSQNGNAFTFPAAGNWAGSAGNLTTGSGFDAMYHNPCTGSDVDIILGPNGHEDIGAGYLIHYLPQTASSCN